MSPLPSRVLRGAAVGGLAFVFVGSAYAQDRFPDTLPVRPPANHNAPSSPGNTAANRPAPSPTSPSDSSRPAQNPLARPNPNSLSAPNPSSAPREAVPAPVSVNATSSKFAAVAALETKDFGIASTAQLRGNPQHAPTPTQIPGGTVISTEALHAMTQQKESPFIIFDVLGGQQGLPGAQNAQPAGNDGTFSDATQRDFGNYLMQATREKRDVALIFYCQNTYCWRSYNAALRAIKLGYTRVYWYRGGIEAWTQAGLPTFGRQ